MTPDTTATDTSTRDRLLEKAAELFAIKGFDQVSLRDLTQAAGVNLAAVNYHFGSKDGLIECLVERLMNPTNEERLALLQKAQVEAAPGNPDIKIVLRAFLQPVIQRVRQTEMSEMLFFKLMGRCFVDRANVFPPSSLPLLEKVVAHFADALQKCAPELERPRIFWYMNFTIGALVQTLIQGELLVALTKGVVGPITAGRILDELVDFCAAAFAQSTGQKT